MPTNGIRLFRLFGITVFLHWSWIVVALYEVEQGRGRYSSLAWNAAEYLGLFGIVLLHEFGHALACRSVGGRADRILLWPLGGIAYVSPPPRPGAVLWSIAAGPLVNVLLLPACWPFLFAPAHTDAAQLVRHLAFINVGLLVFNLLPIFPLDGGQILQSLLWFVIGRANSLAAASVVGMVGAAGLGGLAIYWHSLWTGVIAVFAATSCWAAWKQSAVIRRYAVPPPVQLDEPGYESDLSR